MSGKEDIRPKVSCCNVTKTMCMQSSDSNVFWLYFLRPVLIAIAICVALGVVYLYIVPFTNIVGQAMFADYKCYPNTGVWGVCGRITISDVFDSNGSIVAVGFLVFLVIQVTVTMALISLFLFCASRRRGRFNTITSESLWCSHNVYRLKEWREDGYGSWKWNDSEFGRRLEIDQYDDNCCCAPQKWCISGIWVGLTSIFFSTVIVGIYVGRVLAVSSVPQCMPFSNTRIGLYGCVDALGAYVGGDACTACAGVGFGILVIPLFTAEVVVVLVYYAVKSCRRNYISTRKRLEEERDKEFVEYERQRVKLQDVPVCVPVPPLTSDSVIVTTPVEVIGVVLGQSRTCTICAFDRAAYIELPCKHSLCLECAKAVRVCPFCRAEYSLKGIDF